MAGKFRARGVAIALVAGAAAVVLLGGVAAASVTAQPMAPVLASSPTVTGVSPSSGPPAGGTVVTIVGTNFTNPSTVSFGTLAGTGVQFVSASELKATSPAGTGTVDVTVTTTVGTSATSASDKFSYL